MYDRCFCYYYDTELELASSYLTLTMAVTSVSTACQDMIGRVDLDANRRDED